MSNIDKPFSFHTLFGEKFRVTQQELGRKPESALTQEARERFLSREVEVTVDEIVIPKLQRDYAQGRPNEKEVRDRFLQSLFDAIEGRGRCSLNFLYGHFVESRERDGAVTFIPYDGQQRLTTLFLLHWYASRRENDTAAYLRRFRYDTRFSSTTFTTMFLPEIKNLLLSEAEAKWLKSDAVAGQMVPVGVFSRWLMNKNGFAGSWQDDPTVRGMLEMLDAIHAKFHNVPDLWQKLRETDPDKLPIYFYFQRVARSADAGSIFIKMNSRGKQLTEFECFKADFLRLLRTAQYPEVEREQLANKINKTWEQTFWAYAGRAQLDEMDTDTRLMRYVNFVIDLIDFRRKRISEPNSRSELELYSPNRFKQFASPLDDPLSRDAIDEMLFAVDTWCGADAVDSYLQRIFRVGESAEGEPSRIRLFFNMKPDEIFKAIVEGTGMSIDARAIFYAVLVARRLKLPQEDLDLRLRSVRNLVYSMDKGVNELPYILQKIDDVMRDGVVAVDFSNTNAEGSQRKFIDAQIREEQFKEGLAKRGSPWYRAIRELEELDWFKGQVGGLLEEVLDKTDAAQIESFMDSTFAKRIERFKRLFCSGPIPDTLIRKALLRSSNSGTKYWVSVNEKFWMGASSHNFAWKADHPYFTRSEGPREALRSLLDHSFFDKAEGSGKALLESFTNRPLEEGAKPFDVVYYLTRYYDDFFERWSKSEEGGQSGCVGRILAGGGGLTMQMLDGKTRSKPYWDPYLYVALKHVDKASCEEGDHGKFCGLIKQYDTGSQCSIFHRKSNAEIWCGADGIHLKASDACYDAIKGELPEMEVVSQPPAEGEASVYLLRTRPSDVQSDTDWCDRIKCCEKLLNALITCYPGNDLPQYHA